MPDYTAPTWLFPKEGAWESFVKGSQAGAAIAANRIRAQQVYADVRQGQQKIDLAEREQVTREQAADLHNEVVRTKLSNDAADFKSLQDWWPKFQKSDGEITPPALYNENTMIKVSQEIAQKRSKVGMAKFAEFMAAPGRDLTNPSDRAQYYDLLSQYQNIPDKLGPNGIMAPIKMAEDLKRLGDAAKAKAAADVGVPESVVTGVDEQGNPVTEDFVRFGNHIFRSTKTSIITDEKSGKRFIKSATGALHPLDSADEASITTDPVTGEQSIQTLPMLDSEGKQVGLGYRGAKGGIVRIPQNDAVSKGDTVRYNSRIRELNAEEKAKVGALTGNDVTAETDRLRTVYDLKRREVTDKFFPKAQRAGLQNPAAPVAAPTLKAPMSDRVPVISPDGKVGTVPSDQLDEALKTGYQLQ